jgi:hypothetical protein
MIVALCIRRLAKLKWLSQRSQGTRRKWVQFLRVPCDLCERFSLTLLVECTLDRQKWYQMLVQTGATLWVYDEPLGKIASTT